MSEVKIYSRYDRPEVKGLECPEKSLTEQVYAEQCDLNFLIKQYHLEDNPYQLATYVSPGNINFRYLDAPSIPDIYSVVEHFKQVSKIFAMQSYAVQAQYNFSADAFAASLLQMTPDELKKLNIPNLYFEPVPDPNSSKPASNNGSDGESQSKTLNSPSNEVTA